MVNRITLVNKSRFFIVLLGLFVMISLVISIIFLFDRGPKSLYTKGLKDKIIVLDAGHGGFDPGAEDGEVKEKDINIQIVRKLEKILKKNKIKVILTRDEDSGIIPESRMTLAEQDANLKARRAFALKEEASIFVSVHVNSSPNKKASGASVYYQKENDYYQLLAESIQTELNKLYTKKWSIQEANFVVINNTEMPSILVEIGFITNQHDKEFILSKEGQEKIANAIYLGLVNYGTQLKGKEGD